MHPDFSEAEARSTRTGCGRRSYRLEAFVLRPRLVAASYLVAAVVAGVQQVLLGPHLFEGRAYTNYNNFRIFKQSFLHLVHGQDLYVRYPAEHWDLFLYSPTFAAFMAPFAFLPDVVGLLLWNLLNAGVLLLAIRKLPVLDARGKALAGWFLLPEVLTSLQNSQSNVLIAGLLILAFDLLEAERTAWAALLFVSAFYVKLFGIFAAVVFLVYPHRRRFLASAAGWLALLGAVPLLFVSAGELRSIYASWLRLLSSEYPTRSGLSVMGWLHGWFGLDPPKPLVVLAGAALVLAPLARARSYRDPAFRTLFFASTLIWMIVFNYRAESATFVIAMCGVALWYFPQARRPANVALVALAFVLTSLSPRFPEVLRREIVVPYALKAVPCILVWLKIVFELVFSRYAAALPVEVETRTGGA